MTVRYLLDTNVISEVRKPKSRAAPSVRLWVSACKPSDLCLSVITVLEIELGITRLANRDPAQAERLQMWLEADLLEVFSGRILPVDVSVARRAARLHVPDPRPERDALIAATALTNGLTVVTRNVSDFEPLGVAIVNPWSQVQP